MQGLAKLSRKVVLIGGHPQLVASVRNRFEAEKNTCVELFWCTAQDGPRILKQATAQMKNATVVIILTGYNSHKLSIKVNRVCESLGIKPKLCNFTGITRVAEAIKTSLPTA